MSIIRIESTTITQYPSLSSFVIAVWEILYGQLKEKEN